MPIELMIILTILSLIICFILLVYIIDPINKLSSKKYCILPFIVSTIIPIWTVSACMNQEKEFYTLKRYVQSAEGVDFVVVDSRIFNLNQILGRDFEAGSEITLIKEKETTKYFIYFREGDWQCRAD